MKVKFIKSPTGKYRLGYSIGDELDVKDDALAKEMVSSGWAVEVKAKKKGFKK